MIFSVPLHHRISQQRDIVGTLSKALQGDIEEIFRIINAKGIGYGLIFKSQHYVINRHSGGYPVKRVDYKDSA